MDRLFTSVARRAGTYGLLTLKPSNRAEILEVLVEDMVSVVAVGGAKITLYTPFPGLIFRADSLPTKEPDTIAWIDSVKDGCVFWDIGANVGVYSLYAAVKRHSVVLAFEPASANLYALTRNIHLNGLNGMVEAYCVAFSGMTSLGVVNLSSEAMGSATNQFGKTGEVSRYLEPSSRQYTQGMVGFTIDDFIEQFDPPFPNHIKVDVDGLEFGILSGARQTLSDSRLESVLVELCMTDPEETGRAVSILAQAGLQLVSRGELQGIGRHKGANHLFRRPGVS